MVYNKNISQPWVGFSDVDENYLNQSGWSPTGLCWKSTDLVPVMAKDVINNITYSTVYTLEQALESGDVKCKNVCEKDKLLMGCEEGVEKKGNWITNFLMGLGLYRPIPTYNPMGSPISTTQYQGGVLYGCMNPRALNYNPMANTDDGTCQVRIGLSPWAWVGIGIGTLLLIIGINALIRG